jgi:hypothetical protein
VILGERVYAFRIPHPRDGSGLDVGLFVCDASGVKKVAELSAVGPGEGKGASRHYPTELAFGAMLRLGDPRVLDAGSSISRLVYRATSAGGTDSGSALCEMFVPRTARWGEAAGRVSRMVAMRPR